MAHRAPSSSITYKWKYDVFLSFYGDDTRLGFISHLYASLDRSGIHAFIDYKIRDGENITPALFRAIEESRIAIIVFSENYAKSTFCLRELEKILECFKEESRLIYPVFYHVDPSDLRKQGGSYAKALAQLEENRFKDERRKVEKWRQALSQAAELKGCHLKPKDTNEQDCISRITNEVTTRIKRKSIDIANFPVGLESRVKEVISFLDLQSTEETKMIGIWGPGGIGKSTIARAIYNSIADNFESSCFLYNVRKQSKESNGLSRLQETLLCELVMEEHCKLGDYRQGITIIEHRLSQKKTLLILDDVDELDQLQALARSCGRFGSRIIITTRNKQLLESHDVKSIYDVKGLNNEESLKLLCWYAFRKENMDSNYMEVCNRAIQLSCGFPIVLEVIGSNLCGKGVDLWSSALDQFKSEPHRIVFDTLKLSYDTLQDVEKQVFLDLACLFNGEKLTYVTDILRRVRAKDPKYAIEVLTDKSLVKFERDRVTMHDLIEDLGKEIVRRESNEPGKRSRLWLCNDILHVLQCDTGTDKVEAIILDLPESIEVQWSGEEFLKMENLKMLVIKKACFSKHLKDLPNSLRWLEWKGYPFKSLPRQKFLYLSHMSLRNCKFLQQIPDLSGASNLTELWLDGCTNLIKIHDSVGCLKKLRELSAMRCKNLKILPSHLKLTSLEHLKLFGCSSLQRFPEISVMMEEMQTLDLEKTAITELPYSICNLIGLKALNVEKCPNLKQLPACICTLPNLEEVSADLCEGMRHFKMCEGGDEASLYCSKSLMLKKSSKMEQLCFSSCNLSDDSLAFCLSHFTNMIHLDLSSNSFTILPECIKEYYNLKLMWLDNCNQLEHIEGMPPNLETFSAICCSSLTKLSRSKVLKQAFNFQPGKRNFIFPGKKFPERLHNYSRGSSVSFWVRNVLPTTFLWILVKDDHDYVYNCQVSVHINDTKLNITSKWIVQSTIKTDHIYICDMQSIILNTELPLRNKWNEVKVSLESKAQQKEDEKEVYFGIHLHNLQSHSENIRFMDPRRYSIDHILLQNIQEQDWEELEEYMNVDPPIRDGGSTSVHVASNRVTKDEDDDHDGDRDLSAVKEDDDCLFENTDFSRWEKGERIGVGGYGIVYVAHNREIGALCAVKELKDIHKLGNIESIQKEIKILSQLEHTNIVKYYGHEIDKGGCISLYMEYIQPGSLKKYIRGRGALPEPLIQNFTAQILNGLVYLHRKRVVHRDIKPDNLLVNLVNIVKLDCFGLSEHLTESVGKHSQIGTVYYAAPEVLVNQEYKSSCEACAADIWSLGCVIIEMFSGKHPWPGFEPVQALYQVCIVKQRPPIPEGLCRAGKNFLELCFTRTPTNRPSAAELLDHPFVKPQTFC